MIDINKTGKLIGCGLDAEVSEYDGDKIIKTFKSKFPSLIEFYRYCHQNPHPNLPVIHEIFEGDSFGYVGKKYKKLEIEGLEVDNQYILITSLFNRNNILWGDFDVSSINDNIKKALYDSQQKARILYDEVLVSKIRRFGMFCKEIIKIKPVDLSWDLHDDNILVDENDNWIINDPFTSC